MGFGTTLLIGLAGKVSWLSMYPKESVYIFASVISMVGFVMQDVVAIP